ncbi:hypothetical protein HPB48_001847 [Haemaphysalis longicornis]|uniref:Uncharacterized protein n=1 Tax=Haemaphysalis longicornis TaxID=44386 RepID=A0A9J6G369_HAELO|nr:hypothetical protein HPB48_001847 [Haemaphysalis longicornis]
MIQAAVGNGVIVSIGSVVSKGGFANSGAYASSKAALVALAKTVAQEVASRSIRCNAALPGLVQTSMAGELLGEDTWEFIYRTPMHGASGTTGRSCACAGAIAFPCTPSSSYITGAALDVTGGYSM